MGKNKRLDFIVIFIFLSRFRSVIFIQIKNLKTWFVRYSLLLLNRFNTVCLSKLQFDSFRLARFWFWKRLSSKSTSWSDTIYGPRVRKKKNGFDKKKEKVANIALIIVFRNAFRTVTTRTADTENYLVFVVYKRRVTCFKHASRI